MEFCEYKDLYYCYTKFLENSVPESIVCGIFYHILLGIKELKK